MTYIVLDLEWNQPTTDCKPIPDFTTEIIQIGAVKMDCNFMIIDTFKTNIRPKFYSTIKPEVQKLTGLDSNTLKQASLFPQAAVEFEKWCGKDFCFITWSHEDLPILRKNLNIYQLDTSWLSTAYDLQIIYSFQILKKYQQTSLQKAMNFLTIIPELNTHDALHDAFYTAQICQHLDMRQGIDCYTEYQKQAYKGRSLYTKKGTEYHNLREIFQDSSLQKVHCPYCGNPLPSYPWKKSKKIKRFFLTSCSEHGIFEVRLRIYPKPNNTLGAKTTIYSYEP